MAAKRKLKRIDVPLRMYEGNIEALLANTIPVETISFRWAEDTVVPTLILMVGGSELHREEWKKANFTTGKISEDDD